MKTKNRTYTLGIRLKDHEKRYIAKEADKRGQRLSEYVRGMLLTNAIYEFSDGKIKA